MSDLGDLVIVLNGEIFNYRQLREELVQEGVRFRTVSDTEVVLRGYRIWGRSLLDRLRGMFAFCIFDESRSSLFLARDHFGQKPLYYFAEGEDFCFSSTILAFLASGVRDRFSLSSDAIRTLLAFGSFISPATVLRNVSMLPPGHCLTVGNGGVIVERYFNLASSISLSGLSDKNTLSRTREVVTESVRAHLVSDVPVGVFLSGGIDSSIIALAAASILGKSLHTYTIGFGAKHRLLDESGIAEETARKIGSVHETIQVEMRNFLEALDEFVEAIDVPSSDGFNTFLLARAIRSKVKVVLSGVGGDEAFCGYPVFHHIYRLGHPRALDGLLARLPRGILYRIKKEHLAYRSYSLRDILLASRIEHEYLGEIEIGGDLESLPRSNLQKAALFEISYYLPNTLLRDTDAVSMYWSLEVRAPFVDREMMEHALNLPDADKISEWTNKPALVEAFRRELNPGVFRLAKRGFVLPIDEWMTDSLLEKSSKDLLEPLEEFRFRPRINPFSGEGKRYVSPRERFIWLVLSKWLHRYSSVLSPPSNGS